MPEVDRLREGHRTVGSWSLGQICQHLATVMRRVVDLPASTPVDPSQRLPEERKQQVFRTGQLPEGLPAPPELLPDPAVTEEDGAEALRSAIAHFNASATGPVVPHRLFGPLSKDEWHRLQCIHCAHHLGFALPDPDSTLT